MSKDIARSVGARICEVRLAANQDQVGQFQKRLVRISVLVTERRVRNSSVKFGFDLGKRRIQVGRHLDDVRGHSESRLRSKIEKVEAHLGRKLST